MSVYKEGYHALGLLEQNSRRIYHDACDFGCPVKKGDQIFNWGKQLVEWYGEKETRKESDIVYGKIIEIEVSLMDEWSTGNTEIYKITYHWFCKQQLKVDNEIFDGFYEVEKIKVIPGTRRIDD